MTIRCLLVSINTVTSPYPVYPLGMAHLAGALEKHGHEALQYDVLVEDGIKSLSEVVERFSPDLVGISIRNVDTVDSADPQFFMAKAIETIQAIRSMVSSPIVLGGGAFSLFPEAMMKQLGADYGVTGEGEVTLCDLADSIDRGMPPAKGTILTGFPYQDGKPWLPVGYDHRIYDYYRTRGGMLNVQTKRGCPFRCDYCSYPLLEGKKFRYRDPDEVAEEVMRLTRDYDARYIFFTDAVFNDFKGQFREVAEALIRKENKTPWCAYFRPTALTKEDVVLMKRSGLSTIEFGTDASCNKTLKAMHKAFKFEDVWRTQEIIDSFEIPSAHFIIFGAPEETPETLEEGLENIRRLGTRTAVFGFSGVRVLPNTPMHRRAIQDGVLDPDNNLLEPFFYFSPQIDREYMEQRIKDDWVTQATRVFPVASSQDNIQPLFDMGVVGPLWDKLIALKRPRTRRLKRASDA